MNKALDMVTPVIVGFFVGRFIDQYFNTSPGWTLGLTMLGIATGVWSVIKSAYHREENGDKRKSNH